MRPWMWTICCALLMAACGQGQPPDGTPPAMPDGALCVPDPQTHNGLLLAGSGSNLAATRFLLQRYRAMGHPEALRVAESIGTGGAVRAVMDGVIDVGLASRTLSPKETSKGVVQTPMARSVLAFATHRTLGVQALTTQQLLDIYAGRTARWPSGEPVVPLLREEGDSGMRAIAARSKTLAEAMSNARRDGRALVFHTDQEMRDALLAIEGAVGPLDVGIIELEALPIEALTLDGVQPTAQEAAAGRYPFTKSLYWLTDGPPKGQAARFLEFATAPAQRAALEVHGYLPLP